MDGAKRVVKQVVFHWSAARPGTRLEYMFEYSRSSGHRQAGGLTAGTESVVGWVEALGNDVLCSAEREDRELIDRIRALEELKAAASAAQARAAAAFDASQRRKQAAAGVRREELGRGVASQVALARRESPSRGGRLLGFAKVLTSEMPCTLQALTEGRISEWRATLLVRETACLSLEDRQRVDAEVAGDPDVLEGLGDRQISSRARGAAYRLDPAAAVKRAAKAHSERFVSCRPAPDTMTYLTGLLPVAQGVGVYAALSREADRLRAQGDARGRGQIMADTLVERITGEAEAGQMRVEVQLVMSDRTLLEGDSEPALVPGYGPVPAQWARDLVRDASGGSNAAQAGAGGEAPAGGQEDAGDPNAGRLDAGGLDAGGLDAGRQEAAGGQGTHDSPRHGPGQPRRDKAAERWIRRLYTAPDSGQLIGMDARTRLFPRSLARFIASRDQTCRMPWCGAPIRHLDHIRPHREGGATSAANGQGLCEACNQAKEAPDWQSRTVDQPGPHTVETTTPTGHTYQSTAPPLPGGGEPPGTGSSGRLETGSLETCIVDYLRAA